MIQKFLANRPGLKQYNHVTNVIDAAIEAYEMYGEPVLEVFVCDWGYDTGDVHVTAANQAGEDVIKSMLEQHPNVTSTGNDVIEKPLPFIDRDQDDQ